MPGRILLVENLPGVLDTWGRLLEAEGYTVIKASTLETAERVMKETWIHLVILDIRMEREDDKDDISGLLLAGMPEFEPIPKIILSAYRDFDYARKALTGRAGAAAYIDKAEGPHALLEAVKRVLGEQVGINWLLEIHWDRQLHSSFLSLAERHQPDLAQDIVVQRASELEDLFRKLFFGYQQLRIRRLLWQERGRFCLAVLAQTPLGAVDHRLVVCGERTRLEEPAQLEELAPEALGGTRLVERRETLHFDASCYSLPAIDIDQVKTLGDLFQEGAEALLRKALEHLLRQTLPSWHQRGQLVDAATGLMSLYRRWVGLGEEDAVRAEVERRVVALLEVSRTLGAVDIKAGEGTVTFLFPQSEALVCPEPVARVFSPLDAYDSPVVCRISPGWLSAENVLVEPGGQTWLTDLARAGQAPEWWDYVCLEAVIRFDLGQASDLTAWQEFEQCLVEPTNLHEPLRVREMSGDLRRNALLIQQIRSKAGSETGQDPLPYYAGLLVWAVRAMSDFDPGFPYVRAELMRGAHLLLAAGMIACRLQELAGDRDLGNKPSAGSLRLDEDGVQVFIGESRVCDLVGQEKQVFHYLYARAGETASRRELLDDVFAPVDKQDREKRDHHLTALVSRLRQAIEPNPRKPRFILTVRGGGYRLERGD